MGANVEKHAESASHNKFNPRFASVQGQFWGEVPKEKHPKSKLLGRPGQSGRDIGSNVYHQSIFFIVTSSRNGLNATSLSPEYDLVFSSWLLRKEVSFDVTPSSLSVLSWLWAGSVDSTSATIGLRFLEYKVILNTNKKCQDRLD